MAPYWRLALQQEWEHRYLMIGTFGLHGSLFPDVLSGPRDTYSDVGADAQFETAAGSGNVVLRASEARPQPLPPRRRLPGAQLLEHLA